MQIDLISLAFSLMLSNPSIENVSYNRFGEVGFRTKHIESSRTWERNNGVSSNGESFELSYKTWKNINVTISHFRNTGSNMNFQTILTRHGILGQEIIYQNWFKNNPKILNWIGFKHNFKKLTIGFSYSNNFEAQIERFSKKEMEISYHQKLKGRWYLQPSFKRKSITENEKNKSDWKFQINFRWLKE